MGFAINQKNPVPKPSQQIEFLLLKIDTHTMTLSLTEEKIEKVILKCRNLLSHPYTTVGMNKTDSSDVINCPCLLVYN